jgi:hypothetical protein
MKEELMKIFKNKVTKLYTNTAAQMISSDIRQTL